MSPLLRLAALCSALLAACSGVPAVVAPEPKTTDELVQDANAMIDSVSARVSERDLTASIASEHIALLQHRVGKLRARCEQMPRRERLDLEPHLAWLTQLHTTTTLSIGVLRNDSRDFEEDKAEVLLWTKVFVKEIDSLERRVDRIAPVNILLTQRSRK